MPGSKSSTPLLLTLGVSFLVAGAVLWVLMRPGAPVVEAEVSDLYPYRDDTSGKWGYLGRDGRIAIEAKYGHADLFHGLGLVEYEGVAGYVDAQGQWAIPPRFALDPGFDRDVAARPFWGGLAAARREGVWGFIDRGGGWAVEPRFEGMDGFAVVGDFHDGLAWFRSAGGTRYGYIDTEGNIVIEPAYKGANDFGDGLAAVLVKDEWGVIDTSGSIRIRPDFAGLGVFSERLCPARDKHGLLGFIDRDGDWAIDAKFAEVGGFHGGVAPVRQPGDTRWGYINSDGSWAILPRFDRAWGFDGPLAPVVVDGERRYIDADGTTVWPRR